MPHLLRHSSTVYKGHFRGLVTLTPVGSCHQLFYLIGSFPTGNRTPISPCEANALPQSPRGDWDHLFFFLDNVCLHKIAHRLKKSISNYWIMRHLVFFLPNKMTLRYQICASNFTVDCYIMKDDWDLDYGF